MREVQGERMMGWWGGARWARTMVLGLALAQGGACGGSPGGGAASGGAGQGGAGGGTAAGGGGSAGWTATAVQLQSARGVEVDFVALEPPAPLAAVLLLEGGDGKIDIGGSPEQPDLSGNQGFLVRNAERFAGQALLTVVLDVPADHGTDGISPMFRQSAEHAQDIEAVLDWMQGRAPVARWVAGMSMGSFSACNAAIALPGKVDGLALLSALTHTDPNGPLYQSNPNGVLDMALGSIAMPALVVGHQSDACPDTPPSGVPSIVAALSAASPAESQLFDGGQPAQSQPCGPLAPHGYWGIDAEVAGAVGSFVLQHASP